MLNVFKDVHDPGPRSSMRAGKAHSYVPALGPRTRTHLFYNYLLTQIDRVGHVFFLLVVLKSIRWVRGGRPSGPIARQACLK